MNKHELLSMEDRLWVLLHRLLGFEAHALYFPKKPPQEPVWLPDEDRLLLPLRQSETYGDPELGVFMARGLQAAKVEALLPHLADIASICLDNLELYKAGRLDAQTQLRTRAVLTEQLNNEAAAIRAPFVQTEGHNGTIETSMSLLVVRFAGTAALIRQAGHGFVQALMGALATAFRNNMPKQAVAARIGDYEFAVLLPGGGMTDTQRVALELCQRLEKTTLPDPLTNRQIGMKPSIGFVIYPHDMDGTRSQDMELPAQALLHKAALAADVAQSLASPADAVMAYSKILEQGGHVQRILPMGRFDISLGRAVGTREGQRFSVWSTTYPVQTHPESSAATTELQPLYKGEIVVLESGENGSVAELLQLGDPSWPLQPGDLLRFMPIETRTVHTLANTEETPMPAVDAQTGLCRHGEFLARLTRAREQYTTFTLALLQVISPTEWNKTQDAMTDVAQCFHERLQQTIPTTEDNKTKNLFFGGRFALNSLIFFHAQKNPSELKEIYTTLCTDLAARGITLAVGLTAWPFLQYRAADALDCVQKALEYALLLPTPQVGTFDSLALNISADKHHCRGDLFAAIEEYKQALLADVDNALAWNSLGVCMTGLGRHAEALRHFQEAQIRTPDDPAIAYNLGVACQSLEDWPAATEHYQHCLALTPQHVYAQIRLGQLADLQNNSETAKQCFLAATALDKNNALPYRYLARIAYRQGEYAVAREHLHHALLCNPRDPESLTLLARLYLEGGEDIELAETLARQSLALQPNRSSAWIVLARILEHRGLMREAKDALVKAEETT